MPYQCSYIPLPALKEALNPLQVVEVLLSLLKCTHILLPVLCIVVGLLVPHTGLDRIGPNLPRKRSLEKLKFTVMAPLTSRQSFSQSVLCSSSNVSKVSCTCRPSGTIKNHCHSKPAGQQFLMPTFGVPISKVSFSDALRILLKLDPAKKSYYH